MDIAGQASSLRRKRGAVALYLSFVYAACVACVRRVCGLRAPFVWFTCAVCMAYVRRTFALQCGFTCLVGDYRGFVLELQTLKSRFPLSGKRRYFFCINKGGQILAELVDVL